MKSRNADVDAWELRRISKLINKVRHLIYSRKAERKPYQSLLLFYIYLNDKKIEYEYALYTVYDLLHILAKVKWLLIELRTLLMDNALAVRIIDKIFKLIERK